jgi:hypothetical protein
MKKISNYISGRVFENCIKKYFDNSKLLLRQNFSISVGHKSKPKVKKDHSFDLGSEAHKILVECKSHRWTVGKNIPSAKLSVWNEAIYYFDLAPDEYQKWLIVLHSQREHQGESLLSYYKRIYAHLIPSNVELFEFDPVSSKFIGEQPKF